MTTEIFPSLHPVLTGRRVARLHGNSGSISKTATAFSIGQQMALPLCTPGSQFRAYMDNEVVIVPTQTGKSLTGITRGADGTQEATHADGCELVPVFTNGGLLSALGVDVPVPVVSVGALTVVSGTPQQDATGLNSDVYVEVTGHALGTVAVAIGSANTVTHAIVPASDATLNRTTHFRLPANWWFEVTVAGSAAIASAVQVAGA